MIANNTDICANCGYSNCYWYGRSIEERKERNNGQDPAVFQEDECEGYIAWDELDNADYTDEDIYSLFIEQRGEEDAISRFGCRACALMYGHIEIKPCKGCDHRNEC